MSCSTRCHLVLSLTKLYCVLHTSKRTARIEDRVIMEGNQRSPVFAALQLCVWLCCMSGVLAENCTSLEVITFANIIYNPPASAGANTYAEGTVATTQCDGMYAVFPRASAERTCVNGSWSGPTSSCRHIGRRCQKNDFLVGYLGRTCSTACMNRPGRACPRDNICVCDGVCGWSCVATENCTALSIENGNMLHYDVGDIILHGSVVEYDCDDGYEGVSSHRVECRHGNLLPEVPTCLQVDVGRCSPTTAEHGSYSIEYLRGTLEGVWDGNYADNTRLNVSVTCDDGYLAEPFVRTKCQLGTWTLPWPACERQQLPCEVPVREGEVRFFLNGDETRELHPYDSVPGGSFLAARCHDPGKGRLLGDSRRQCDYGEWLGEAPRCEIVAAAVLFNGLHRQVASNGTEVVFPINRPGSSWGNRLKVFCRKQQWSWSRPVISASSLTTSQSQREIILNSPTSMDSGNFTCTLDGSSHTVEVIFSEMYCPEPVITHGSVDKRFEWIPDRYPMKQEITFVCDDGYRLRPSQVYNNRHTCIMGQWSDDIPRCELFA